MKIVVCVKQVPDTKGGVKFNPDGTLDRGAMLTIMNPDDKAGLEAALRIKDEYGAEVTVLTMGLPKAEEVLREAMAMGADKGILVTDRVLGGADTWATSTTIAYVKERKQFGRTIAQQQNTQFQLADMAAKIDAAKFLVYRAAMAKATQKVYSVEAAKAKLFAAETAMDVTTRCVQLFGGYGYIREYDVERMMRDAKITEIYEGTSEVQRMVISANLLK